MKAPVVLFVYNRPSHTRRTVEALRKNPLCAETDLIVFSDAAKNSEQEALVSEVRAYVRGIEGFKSVSIFDNAINQGLAQSVIQGVSKVLAKRDRIITLEDDLIVSPYFLEYMNDALDLYANEESVSSVHGYMFPISSELPETFFLKDPGCWGWGTWKRSWDHFVTDGQLLLDEVKKQHREKEFNFDGSYDYLDMLESQVRGENSSWAIRWYATNFLRGNLTLYPGKSLVENIGHDASGTHSIKTEDFKVMLADRSIRVKTIPICENNEVREKFIRYLRSIQPSPIRRIVSRLRKVLKRSLGVAHVSPA